MGSFLLFPYRRWIDANKIPDLISPPKEPPKLKEKEEPRSAPANQLTAEEEAELAELMSDDD